MYCHAEKKKDDNAIQRNRKYVCNIQRSNVVQRTRYRYNRVMDHWDEVEEKGAPPSPQPNVAETKLLLKRSGSACIEVNTADRGYLETAAEAAGWNRVGAVAQNTRWQLPESEMGRSEPHPYRGEYKIKRFMRWIATYLSVKCNINSEVQCYYDASSKRILVAANKDSDIRTLKSKVGEMSLANFLQNVSGEPLPIKFRRKAKTLRDRQKRHIEHLKTLSDTVSESEESDVKKISFYVVDLMSKVRNLHAEQRILYYLRWEATPERREEMLAANAIAIHPKNDRIMLRPELLGGKKRPCLMCTYACFSPEDRAKVHPGMYWPTDSASILLEPDVIVDLLEAIRAKHTVYRTAAGDRETEEMDSDSVDEYVAGSARLPMEPDEFLSSRRRSI